MTVAKRWMRTDGGRSWISAVVATVLTALAVTIWVALDSGMAPYSGFIGSFLAWTLLTACHTALTHRVFARLEGEDLARALDEDAPTKKRTSVGPSWSVQVSILALIVIGALVLIPGARSVQALLLLGLIMVLSSWASVALTYAVHYARVDAAEGGLRFPGREPQRTFTDYLYLALTVQTAFTTSDTAVETSHMRKVMMWHSVLAFVFNSVIIAVILALLLGAR